MKSVLLAVLMTAVSAPVFAQSQPPVAGQVPLATVTDKVTAVATGWSAKKQVLGIDVYNEKNEKIGKVEDVIIAPDKNVSFLIVGVGGFLGMDRHDVAIPIASFSLSKDKLTLPNASKDALKAMPEFQYKN